MLNNISIGRYYKIQTTIHFMNPISKLLCLILFIISSTISSSLILNMSLLIFTLIIISFSKVDLKVYIKSIWSLKVLILFIFLIGIFSGGLYFSFVCVIRLINTICYGLVFIFTTTTLDITYSFQKVLYPLKKFNINVNKIGMYISLALSFMPMIFLEADKILKSQSSRGIDYYNASFKDKLKYLKSILVPLFSLSIKRSDSLADSMEVRLFSFNTDLTQYKQYKWSTIDLISLVCHFSLFVFVVLEVMI